MSKSKLFTTPAATLVICVAATLGASVSNNAIAQSASTTTASPTAPAVRPAAAVRMRGTIINVTPTTVTVKDRSSGETVELLISETLRVSEVFPNKLEDIQPSSYIGTAAMPQPDGTLRAIAISVFPEASRGVAEGHFPFDLLPQSTMTNATVTDVATLTNTASGRKLKLKYKDDEKTLLVPDNTPVVTSKPGDRSLLVTGASVSLSAQEIGGRPTLLRINAGRNGFVLPY